MNHSEPQLDFILLKYVEDNPRGDIKVTRTGEEVVTDPQIAAKWADVLTGKDYDEYMGKEMPPEEVMRMIRGVSPVIGSDPGTMPKPPSTR